MSKETEQTPIDKINEALSLANKIAQANGMPHLAIVYDRTETHTYFTGTRFEVLGMVAYAELRVRSAVIAGWCDNSDSVAEKPEVER